MNMSETADEKTFSTPAAAAKVPVKKADADKIKETLSRLFPLKHTSK